MTEGMIGTQNQCVGVTNALGLTPTIHKIGLNQPWKTLTPWLGFEMPSTFTPRLNAPWPDLLIVSGRKSIAAARYIKKQSNGKTFTVFIQNPKINSNNFDMVAAPFHDNYTGENVIITNGAPNKITADALANARLEFTPLFKHLPTPRIAVLIGGNSKTHTLTPEKTIEIADKLSTLKAGLMITVSRRTGDENIKILKDRLNQPHHYFYDGLDKNIPNPYLGMLGLADTIIATNDSVSMLSDAGTTGKPVYTIDLDGSSPRFEKLYDHLSTLGIIRPLNNAAINSNLDHWTYEPLNDAKLISDAIKTRLNL